MGFWLLHDTIRGSGAMREFHCSYCHATNRRPKCGSCQKEIAEPPAIELIWKLYQHRKVAGVLSAVVVLALILWRPWESFYFFSPTNYTECKEQAARTARSNDAMRVLIGICSSKFPSNP